MITDDQLQKRIVATLYLLSALVMLLLTVQNYRYGLYELVYTASILMVLFIGTSIYARLTPEATHLRKVSTYILPAAFALVLLDVNENANELKHWVYPLALLGFTTLSHKTSSIFCGVMGGVVFLSLWRYETFTIAIQFAATFAVLVSLASTYSKLHKQRSRTLVELEIHDPLTGAYNYRHLEDTLAKEICRSERTGRPVSLIALEIDYFPQVQDLHGTVATRALLQQFSDTLRSMIRAGDSDYCDANNGFYLVLPGTPPEGLLVIAERIRRFTEEPNWPNVDSITVSLGCKAFQPENGSIDANTMINGANAALIEAQKNGHNRVCHQD